MTIEQIQPEKEPVDLLRESTVLKLQELFPGRKVDQIVNSFIIDILHRKDIPSSLDRMLPEKQKELLLNGEATLEVAIKKILEDVPQDLVDFYGKKTEGASVRDFEV